jgi:hypothetical protein
MAGISPNSQVIHREIGARDTGLTALGRMTGARSAEWSRRRSAATLVGAMPIVEGLSFSYVIHELPRDRLPFRRWRFELWHGARLEAAGWRTTERDALRALRKHGSRVAHGMFGLRAPGDVPAAGAGFRPGSTVQVRHNGLAFALVPRQLEAPSVLGGLPG